MDVAARGWSGHPGMGVAARGWAPGGGIFPPGCVRGACLDRSRGGGEDISWTVR